MSGRYTDDFEDPEVKPLHNANRAENLRPRNENENVDAVPLARDV